MASSELKTYENNTHEDLRVVPWDRDEINRHAADRGPDGVYIVCGKQRSGKTTLSKQLVMMLVHGLKLKLNEDCAVIYGGDVNEFTYPVSDASFRDVSVKPGDSSTTLPGFCINENEKLDKLRIAISRREIECGVLVLDDVTGSASKLSSENWIQIFTTLRKWGLFVIINVHVVANLSVPLRSLTSLLFICSPPVATEVIIYANMMYGDIGKTVTTALRTKLCNHVGSDSKSHQVAVLSKDRPGQISILNNTTK